jgi:predicted peroxiredoxin
MQKVKKGKGKTSKAVKNKVDKGATPKSKAASKKGKKISKKDIDLCKSCYGLSAVGFDHSNASAAQGDTAEVQIILVSGYNEPERCTAGLLMAVACATTFKNVVVFLLMDGAELAAKHPSKNFKIEPFEYINIYIQHLIMLGVKLEVCNSCIRKFFPDITPQNYQKYLIPEATIVGMVQVAMRASTSRTLMF